MTLLLLKIKTMVFENFQGVFSTFLSKNLRPLKLFLGCEVLSYQGGLLLPQQKYRRLLWEANMQDIK